MVKEVLLFKIKFPSLAERTVKDLTTPFLECFNDKDDKARLAALEGLVALCKCLKTMILINFNEIVEYLFCRSAESSADIV